MIVRLGHKMLHQGDRIKGQRLYGHPFGLCPILNTMGLCAQDILICAKILVGLILVSEYERVGTYNFYRMHLQLFFVQSKHLSILVA
jgi:hypothetical protein